MASKFIYGLANSCMGEHYANLAFNQNLERAMQFNDYADALRERAQVIEAYEETFDLDMLNRSVLGMDHKYCSDPVLQLPRMEIPQALRDYVATFKTLQ